MPAYEISPTQELTFLSALFKPRCRLYGILFIVTELFCNTLSAFITPPPPSPRVYLK